MAHLKHPEHGTEIECDDDDAKALVADGWEVSGDAESTDDKPARRSGSTRKKSG